MLTLTHTLMVAVILLIRCIVVVLNARFSALVSAEYSCRACFQTLGSESGH